MSAIVDVLVVQIENTAYCNRKCLWCPQSKMGFTKDMVMDWETLIKIVSELNRLNYKGRIHPYGNGEPLTDEDFIHRVEYIWVNLPECHMYMATNGDLINQPYSFEDLWMSGINAIQCNHYDDRNQDLKKGEKTASIRRNGRFYQVGVEHMDLGDLRTTFYNRAGNVKIANITPSTSCWFPGKKLYFNYLGDMLVCCADWSFKDKIGNIHEQTLDELLESPKLQHYQDCLSMNKAKELPLCSQCNLIRHQEVL